MAPKRSAPLLSIPADSVSVPLRAGDSSSPSPSPIDEEEGVVQRGKKKKWWVYIPTYIALALIILPHFPLLHVIVFYLKTLQSRALFLLHLGVTYFLTAIALTSFLVVVVRDPGPVDGVKAQIVEDERVGLPPSMPPLGHEASDADDEGEGEGDMSLGDMLAMSRIGGTSSKRLWDGNGERRWCQKCFTAKPERAHHCRDCGRCVLKMDHHCPWLGAKCIGHRTYANFVHLLLSISLLCIYIFCISIPPLRHYLNWNTTINDGDWTPYYVLFTALISMVFALMIGSFYGYHLYLIWTNQTTLEHLAPFLILRHIPAVPPPETTPITPSTSSISPIRDPSSPYFFPSPPPERATFAPIDISTTSSGATTPRLQEHTLNFAQRRTVRSAARKILMYDLGWKRNFGEVMGGGKGVGWRWWVRWVVCGGVGKGDGYSFEFNPEAREQLDRLAVRLAKLHTA